MLYLAACLVTQGHAFLRRAPERPHPTYAALTIEPREQGKRQVSRG
jgi:hypothetical protein